MSKNSKKFHPKREPKWYQTSNPFSHTAAWYHAGFVNSAGEKSGARLKTIEDIRQRFLQGMKITECYVEVSWSKDKYRLKDEELVAIFDKSNCKLVADERRALREEKRKRDFERKGMVYLPQEEYDRLKKLGKIPKPSKLC